MWVSPVCEHQLMTSASCWIDDLLKEVSASTSAMVFGGPGTLPLVCFGRGSNQSMSRLKGKGTASKRLSKTCWQRYLGPVYIQQHLSLSAAVQIHTKLDQVTEKAGMQVSRLPHSPFAWALSQVSARTIACKRSSNNHPSIPK